MLDTLSFQKRTSNYYIWIDALFITIFFGLFYAIWMGSYPLFTPDEGRYSEVAREMVATGDYITPRLNHVPFLDKPILYYWLQASAIRLFGIKEWAFRVWPVMLGILGCLITYLAGHRLFNRQTGMIAAIVLATNPLYYAASHYANLDLEVAVFISASLLFFIVGIQSDSNRSRTIFLLLAYAFSAFAALTKGLIGMVFPIMIIGSWILILNRWKTLKKMHLLIGIPLFLLIAAPWYVWVQEANPQFFHFFFVTQQFSRFLTKASFNNKTMVWFYVPLILVGFIPWTVFFFQAFAQNIKFILKKHDTRATHLFLLLWVFLIFMFFSIPQSKTIGYILPILPAIALVVGHYLTLPKTTGIYYGILGYVALCALLSVFCLLAPHIKVIQLDTRLIPYLIFLSATLIMSGITVFFLRKKHFSFVFLIITITSCVFLLTICKSAVILNSKSIKPLTVLIKKELKPEDEVVTYYRYYQDLPIYLERRITIVADWHAADIPQYDNWQREIWYNMSYLDTSEWLIEEPQFWERWNGNRRLFVFLSERFYEDFLRKYALYAKRNALHYLGELSVAKNEKVILVSNRNPVQKEWHDVQKIN